VHITQNLPRTEIIAPENDKRGKRITKTGFTNSQTYTFTLSTTCMT